MKQLLSKSSTTESEPHSCQDHPSLNAKSQHSSSEKSSKHKPIQKTKETLNVDHLLHLEKVQRKRLTKQERHQIQRVKNREAAQKSRDQRRVYIDVLEKENTDLRVENSRLSKELDHSKRLCWKCHTQLEQSKVNLGAPVDEQEYLLFSNQNIGVEMLSEDIQFQRIPISHKDGPDFMSYLFLVTILLAIFVPPIGPVTNNIPVFSDNVRLLKESKELLPTFQKIRPSYPLAEIGQSQELQVYKPHSNFNVTSLSTFMSKSSQECMNNLAKINFAQALVPQKNLRNIPQDNKDILFCQVPRVYKQANKEGFFSRFFDIILQADQLKRIAITTDGITLGNLPYSGLYALKVQMKSVRKYQADDCLLNFAQEIDY